MEFSNRPAHPYGVQWRLDGRRKTKSFATREKQIAFAKALAGDAKRDGLSAYRLNEAEAREWRAFRAQIGADANLDEVARHWLLSGAKASVKVSDAAKDYLAAKSAEGMSAVAHSHYTKWIGRFVAEFGDREAGTITREDVAGWLATLDAAAATRASGTGPRSNACKRELHASSVCISTTAMSVRLRSADSAPCTLAGFASTSRRMVAKRLDAADAICEMDDDVASYTRTFY